MRTRASNVGHTQSQANRKAVAADLVVAAVTIQSPTAGNLQPIQTSNPNCLPVPLLFAIIVLLSSMAEDGLNTIASLICVEQEVCREQKPSFELGCRLATIIAVWLFKQREQK